MDGLPEAQGVPALDPEGLTVLAHADHGPRFVAHWGALTRNVLHHMGVVR
jgi:hypothetical protein